VKTLSAIRAAIEPESEDVEEVDEGTGNDAEHGEQE
jgi:hypothetical protein